LRVAGFGTVTDAMPCESNWRASRDDRSPRITTDTSAAVPSGRLFSSKASQSGGSLSADSALAASSDAGANSVTLCDARNCFSMVSRRSVLSAAGPLADTIARAIQARGIDVLVIGEDNGALSRGHRQLAQHAPCAVFVARARVIQEFAGAIGERTEHWSVRPEARVRLEGLGLMLQVFVGEHDRHDGRPVYEVVIERLRELDVAGAAVFSITGGSITAA